jgi:hypothetical protein
MTETDGFPEGWAIWNDEPDGRAVYVFRPDVFDSQAFPPACLPTISVTPSSPDRPPGEQVPGGDWYVTLYLEPDVRLREYDGRFDSRAGAVAGAREVAGEFAAGEIDFREYYQVPREAYLDELESLTGRE